MIVVQLTGSRQAKEINDKNISYNKSVKSPTLGFNNYLQKNTTTQVLGKLDYEGFLKAIEIIANKMLPEWEISKAVRHLVEKYFLKLEQQITQTAVE
jgi:hypothetical protein